MISTTSHTAHSERPERSRNAKAQARHRAKRKAYIEQLEQTVTKLQTALDFTPEEVAALPPPLLRIRELEQENTRLEKENEELRRMLSDVGSMDLSRRNSPSAFPEARICDRDFKRRKMGGEGLYMNAHDVSQQSGDTISRPPPLMIPQNLSHHHYSQIPSSGSHHSVNGSASMYSLHAPAYQMPDTPSGSSATSSPPFSASVFPLNLKPFSGCTNDLDPSDNMCFVPLVARSDARTVTLIHKPSVFSIAELGHAKLHTTCTSVRRRKSRGRPLRYIAPPAIAQ